MTRQDIQLGVRVEQTFERAFHKLIINNGVS